MPLSVPRRTPAFVAVIIGLLLALVASTAPASANTTPASSSAKATTTQSAAKKRAIAKKRAVAKKRAAVKRQRARKAPKQCRNLSTARAHKVVRSKRTYTLRDGTRRTRTIYCNGSQRVRDVKPSKTKTVERPVAVPGLAVPVPVPGPVVEIPVPGEPVPVPVPEPKKSLRLSLFHNNDGESKLKTGDSVTGYGGVGRFSARLEQLRAEARSYRDAAIADGTKEQADLLVSAGDNILAGLALLTGTSTPGPWPDAIAASRLGYDAVTIATTSSTSARTAWPSTSKASTKACPSSAPTWTSGRPRRGSSGSPTSAGSGRARWCTAVRSGSGSSA